MNTTGKARMGSTKHRLAFGTTTTTTAPPTSTGSSFLYLVAMVTCVMTSQTIHHHHHEQKGRRSSQNYYHSPKAQGQNLLVDAALHVKYTQFNPARRFYLPPVIVVRNYQKTALQTKLYRIDKIRHNLFINLSKRDFNFILNRKRPHGQRRNKILDLTPRSSSRRKDVKRFLHHNSNANTVMIINIDKGDNPRYLSTLQSGSGFRLIRTPLESRLVKLKPFHKRERIKRELMKSFQPAKSSSNLKKDITTYVYRKNRFGLVAPVVVLKDARIKNTSGFWTKRNFDIKSVILPSETKSNLKLKSKSSSVFLNTSSSSDWNGFKEGRSDPKWKAELLKSLQNMTVNDLRDVCKAFLIIRNCEKEEEKSLMMCKACEGKDSRIQNGLQEDGDLNRKRKYKIRANRDELQPGWDKVEQNVLGGVDTKWESIDREDSNDNDNNDDVLEQTDESKKSHVGDRKKREERKFDEDYDEVYEEEEEEEDDDDDDDIDKEDTDDDINYDVHEFSHFSKYALPREVYFLERLPTIQQTFSGNFLEKRKDFNLKNNNYDNNNNNNNNINIDKTNNNHNNKNQPQMETAIYSLQASILHNPTLLQRRGHDNGGKQSSPRSDGLHLLQKRDDVTLLPKGNNFHFHPSGDSGGGGGHPLPVRLKREIYSTSTPNDLPIIELGVLVPMYQSRPFEFRKIAAAVYLAIEKADTSILTRLRLRANFVDSVCSISDAMNGAINLYAGGLAHAFVGPVCDYAVAPVARQIRYWQIPLVTPGALAADFGFRKPVMFPFLTRLGTNFNSLLDFVLNLMHRFNWVKVKVLYHPNGFKSVMERYCHIATDGIVQGLRRRQANVTCDHKSFHSVSKVLEDMKMEVGNSWGAAVANFGCSDLFSGLPTTSLQA